MREDCWNFLDTVCKLLGFIALSETAGIAISCHCGRSWSLRVTSGVGGVEV